MSEERITFGCLELNPETGEWEPIQNLDPLHPDD